MESSCNYVGRLQELLQTRGVFPHYRVLNTRGASHAPVFSMEVQIGELTCVGSGYSKREAKNAAARQMIASLDTAKRVLDTTEDQPAVNDINQNPSLVGLNYQVVEGEMLENLNTVGQLQEFCMQRGQAMPVYTVLSLSAVECRVGGIVRAGTGNSKKLAKKDAAAKVLRMLSETTLNRNHEYLGHNNNGVKSSSNGEHVIKSNVDREQASVSLNQEVEVGRYEEISVTEQNQNCQAGRTFTPAQQFRGRGRMDSTRQQKEDSGDRWGQLVSMVRGAGVQLTRVEERCCDKTGCSTSLTLVQLATAPVILTCVSSLHRRYSDTYTADNTAAATLLHYLTSLGKRRVAL